MIMLSEGAFWLQIGLLFEGLCLLLFLLYQGLGQFLVLLGLLFRGCGGRVRFR